MSELIRFKLKYKVRESIWFSGRFKNVAVTSEARTFTQKILTNFDDKQLQDG